MFGPLDCPRDAHWLHLRGTRDAPDDVAFACHYPAVTRPHNGALPLIDPNEESDLTRFVEAVSMTFRLKEAERGLRVLARAIADVRTTGFLRPVRFR